MMYKPAKLPYFTVYLINNFSCVMSQIWRMNLFKKFVVVFLPLYVLQTTYNACG